MTNNLIDEKALKAAEYREFNATGLDNYKRLFQKAVGDPYNNGRQYFINFREWQYNGRLSYDAHLCCATDTGGNIWATMSEGTIQKTEDRAYKLWVAAGSVPYDK